MPIRVVLTSLLLGLLASLASHAAPPHLDAAGLAAYSDYGRAEDHRAFAIAPGGRWGWAGGALSPDQAREQALAYCQERNEQSCLVYAEDETTVFPTERWPSLWGPYADAAQAARASIGMRRGMRFPDLALTDPKGRKVSLADLRGKVVVLHFWGSWCGVCRREMPEIRQVAGELGSAVRVVLVQVREDVKGARAWLKQQGIDLPLYDSGVRGPAEASLRLANGARLNDRDVARAFPSTYVLDRHGLVLFSHTGAIHRWSEYLPFLRHAVRAAK